MSSVLNNATYHPALRALTNLQPGRRSTSSSQKLNAIRRTACLLCSGIYVRYYGGLSDAHEGAFRHLPQRDPHLLNVRDDSIHYWNELRRMALDTLGSNSVDGGNGFRSSATQDSVPQDGRNVRTASSYPGGRKTKSHSRYYKYKHPTGLTRNQMLHGTLRSFPHLNYESLVPYLADAYQSSNNRAGRRFQKLGLRHILNNYLRSLKSHALHNNPVDKEKEIDRVVSAFDAESLHLLSTEGYSPEDVVAWAWILTAQESFRAVLRLLFWDRQHPSNKQTPLFVVELLLYRKSLDVRSFRILLIYSLSYLTQRPFKAVASATGSGLSRIMDEFSSKPQTIMIPAQNAEVLILNLLKRARQLWPAGQFGIAQAYAYYLIHLLPPSRRPRTDDWRINILLARYFNSCLRALGIPSRHNPFISASIQQRAQFELLKAMAAHEPALPVSRRGYQAIIVVQLAHMKTSDEKVFAKQKALLWPPWKEARMGIDSERGNEGMKSRTMQVLSQMTEAGYSHAAWEDMAGILAGWDTDGSPTIQRRILAMPPKVLRGKRNKMKFDSALWAARIRATRTLREAWACFLSYKSLCAIPSERVYHAMAERLIYSETSKKQNDSNSAKLSSLPGDGLEVFPEPSSARDVIYVPSEPPSIEELLKEMILERVRPSENFVALLLRTSTNFSTGLKYLCCFLSIKRASALCTLYAEEIEKERLDILSAMKPRLFDSFIAFLCAHSNSECFGYRIRKTDLFPILMPPFQSMHTAGSLIPYGSSFHQGDENSHPQVLSHAVKLLKTVKPQRVSSWLPLLQALASLRGPATERLFKLDTQKFLAWYEIVEAIRWMRDMELEPGMDGLMILCRAFSHAVSAGIKDAGAAEEGLFLASEAKKSNEELQFNVAVDFDDFVFKGLRLLKSFFDRLVYPMPSFILTENKESDFYFENTNLIKSELPSMLQVPGPTTLHRFVRALGIAEDHDGILNLLQWMSVYASDIVERANQQGNGKIMMRRTLTAIRVFLEGSIEENIFYRRFEPAANRTLSLNEFDVHNGNDNQETRPIFSDGRVAEAYKIIEDTEGWGSWPSDEEVRSYIRQDTRHI